MTQYYNSQFGAFIKDKFGTMETFADFMNVSLPTARHYAHKPHNMRIMDFIRISEKLEIEAKELFNLIRNESNTNL